MLRGLLPNSCPCFDGSASARIAGPACTRSIMQPMSQASSNSLYICNMGTFSRTAIDQQRANDHGEGP